MEAREDDGSDDRNEMRRSGLDPETIPARPAQVWAKNSAQTALSGPFCAVFV